MRIRTLLRVAPGAWLAPVMVGLLVLYVASSITFGPREPYGLYLTARAMNGLGLIVPVFAGTAAWEGARLVRGGVWGLPMTRHRIAVAAWSFLPAFVGGLIVLVVTTMAVLVPQGLVVPDMVILGSATVILLAQVALGFFIGTIAPRAIAIPVVVLGSFMTFVLPRVAGSAWLRHMSGTTLELCCTTDQVLSPGVVVSIVAISAAILIAVAILLTRRPRMGVYPVVFLVLLIVASGVAMAAAPPTQRPYAERTGTADVCETRDGVTVCVWPEHRELAPRVSRVAAAAVDAWRAAGVTVPTTFREGEVDKSDPLTAGISVRSTNSRNSLIELLAVAVAPHFPVARDEPTCAATHEWRSSIAGPYVWTWLATEAGIDHQSVDNYFGGGARPDSDYFPDAPKSLIVPVLPLLEKVWELPPPAQATWVRRNLRALAQCDVLPPLDPG